MTIAPFNVQVGRLIKELGEKAKVGTIDLFQGQQAKFVFISFTSSDPENLQDKKVGSLVVIDSTSPYQEVKVL